VANPPWGITVPLLRRLLHPGSRLVRADLLLKRSAANRAVHEHHRTPFDLRLGPTVPRRAFRPPPPIDGRVLVAERRDR
jgi:23S rRNA (adenine-N6)-dimethyltransferase